MFSLQSLNRVFGTCSNVAYFSIQLLLLLQAFLVTADPVTSFDRLYARDTSSIVHPTPISTNSPPASVDSFSFDGNVTQTNSTGLLTNVLSLKVIGNVSSLRISADVASLTPNTGRSIISTGQYEGLCVGKLVPARPGLYIPWPDIALINCDNSDEAMDLISQTTSQTSDCIILYSSHSSACNISNTNSLYTSQLGFIMTLLSNTVAESILANVNATASGDFTGIVEALTLTTGIPTAGNTNSGSPSGSTVAMAILYALTGIVAFLFLFVIISGAIRVHKHPERYGLPRPDGPAGENNDIQYSNMYRAKGIARAVLDSIPLVTVRVRPSAESSKETLCKATELQSIETSTKMAERPTKGESGTGAKELPPIISAANATPFIIEGDDDESCPICFDNFQDGQILRILPCKHRFHALCVDPWLLNSSSHCPMCRVDLSILLEEAVPDQPPGSPQGTNAIVIPEGYEVDTSLFNRFLDIWNAHLLPKDAKRTALARFQQEAEFRRQLRSQRSAGTRQALLNSSSASIDRTTSTTEGNNNPELSATSTRPEQLQIQNQNLWLRFVASRRRKHQMRQGSGTLRSSSEPASQRQPNETTTTNTFTTNTATTTNNTTESTQQGTPAGETGTQEQRAS